MSTNGDGCLSLRYTTDADGDTRLRVTASAAGFAGATEIWWGDSDELAQFAAALRGYPLPSEASPALVGGYGLVDAGADDFQEYFSVRVEPIGRLGQVRLKVRLVADASVISPTLRQPVGLHRVDLELLTTYERLRSFSADLLAVAKTGNGEATIDEEWLD